MKDYQVFYDRIKNNLKPGGWVEMIDFPGEAYSDDDTVKDAPNVVEWERLLVEASAKFGKEFSIATEHKQLMANAGFTNVTEEIYKVLRLKF